MGRLWYSYLIIYVVYKIPCHVNINNKLTAGSRIMVIYTGSFILVKQPPLRAKKTVSYKSPIKICRVVMLVHNTVIRIYHVFINVSIYGE